MGENLDSLLGKVPQRSRIGISKFRLPCSSRPENVKFSHIMKYSQLEISFWYNKDFTK